LSCVYVAAQNNEGYDGDKIAVTASDMQRNVVEKKTAYRKKAYRRNKAGIRKE
jgi:hypothetical protein